MTTHLRARGFQAGALLALVGGLLVVAPTPAMAAKPDVSIDNVSTDIAAGTTTNLQYTITRSNQTDPGSNLPIAISVNGNGVSCNGECNGIVKPAAGGSVTRNAQLTAPQVDAGQTKTITLQITATQGTDTATASQQLVIHGADKPQTVRQISGKVKDSTGKAVVGANVGIRDSTNRYYETVSNGDGGYAFTAEAAKPIGVGSITVGAAKDGFKPVTVTVQGGADKSINVPLTMTSLTASASASPSASASVSAAPSEEATAEATEAPTVADTPATDTAGNSKSSSSTLFIVLGGLLVAAGIGAIVLVLMRRRNNDDPDDPDDPDGPGPGPIGVVPPSHGRFNTPDRTRIGAPAGANDQTMVANLAEAPTMMHRAVPMDDEFPDPYGAPAVTPGNYAGPGGWGTTSAAAAAPVVPQQGGAYGSQYGGGAANQYGGAAAVPAQPTGAYDDAAYGAAGQYGRPPVENAYGAYGASQYGGAAEQQRFDEPTGMYRPEPAQPGYPGGYDQGGYEAAPGYGQQPAQPAPASPQGGYREPGQGTGAYTPPGGGYGQPQQGGYPGGGGYGDGQQPADDPGGYGQWNGAPGGESYAPPAGGGGYDQRGGGYGGAAPAPGYGEQGGYDQRGAAYGGGGYEQPPQQGGGGYGQQPAGGQPAGGRGGPAYGQEPYYGEQPEAGGRHGGQPRQQPPPAAPPESTHPGQRRSLDWLDD